ncbi:MAG: zinc-binding protein [Gammaproteobacteria bacterium]|nr:zinc-binding protein [Gammaproteobacteria bacterium]
MRLEITEIRPRVRGRWPAVLAALAPALEPALARAGRHGPCPRHGGRDGFRLFRDVADTGGGICNTCGAFPDGFALLMWLHDWRFPQALAAVSAVLGLEAVAGRYPPERGSIPSGHATDRTSAQARRRIERLWQAACPVNAAPAWPLWHYLAARGLTLEDTDPDVLRLHPQLAYFEAGDDRGAFPALLSVVQGADGQRLTLHRTYLAADGRGKAPVASPRKLLPPVAPLAGAAIRLYAATTTLGVAEGVETALAAHHLSGQPVWAALNATLLERFVPPSGLTQVTIWADRDRHEAGQRAAGRLQVRLQARGIDAEVRLPPGPIPDACTGVDWADVWLAARGRSQAA